MSGACFIILFGLSFVLFPCRGQITSPPDGTRFTFLNGSTANITWLFKGDISKVDSRVWYLTSSDGSINAKRLPRIIDDEKPRIYESGLSGVGIVKPATLVLKNVDQTYDGTYRFSLVAPNGGASDVYVFIAKKPTVTVNCTSPTKLIEDDDFTCVCRGESGNPPANVTWYKDGVQIGGTAKEEHTLTLSNVDNTASGTYKCVAKSHTLTDEKLIEIIVCCAVPPTVVSLRSTPENAVYGKSVVITCEAIAIPLPSYTIIHNGTEISTNKTYIITVLEYTDAGSYKCIATSVLGNSSKTFSLSVAVTQTTNSPTTKNFGTGKAASKECNLGGTEWYIVVVSVVSGIIIGILLSNIFLCSCRKFRSRRPQSNPEPQENEVDTTYQELDLSKMNAEDNYQSLRNRGPQSTPEPKTTEADTTYQELDLSKMNTEDNYQWLRNTTPQSNPEPKTTEADTTYQDGLIFQK
ncbi:hemicentin-1-like isoform X1 [Paramuricea clavata]|uniref:Hemicentin-1-like isoform X1 n=1 Tax=Paramuricea clavata TaxID=317549 RepID=A0A6S7K1N2_PARCT|nr:hemicentin-1-like isoform X1 [Paramuricea clavata]